MPIDMGDEKVDASGLVEEVKSKLQKLSELVGPSKAVTDKDRGRLEAVIQQFDALSSGLGYEPGSDGDEEKPVKPVGRSSLESGNKDVKPVY